MTILNEYIGRSGDWLPLSGSGTVISPRGGASDGLAPTVSQTSISTGNDTIGWTFDGDYECGQYCNGDWFVVGPVTINSISPGSETIDGYIRHGSEIDPPSDSGQGYTDMPTQAANPYYNTSRNVGFGVSPSTPLVLQPNTSLVSTTTMPAEAEPARPIVKSAAVLTVVDAVPPAGSFRPPYCGGGSQFETDKTWRQWTESDIDYSKLPKYALTPSTEAPSTHAPAFSRVWLDQQKNATNRYVHPDDYMPAYGRDLAAKVTRSVLSLCMDFSDAEKRDLLIGLVQFGIDCYGRTYQTDHEGLSGAAGFGPGWVNDGGHNHGRKLPILLAGHVLGDGVMLAKAGVNDGSVWFQENDQLFYVDQYHVDGGHNSVGYTSAMLGMPEWGVKARNQWDANPCDASAYTSYRRNENGAVYVGMSMAARMLGLEGAWNYPLFFEYTDRYRGYGTIDPDWPNLPEAQDTTFLRYNNDFAKEVWETYRGAVAPADWQTAWDSNDYDTLRAWYRDNTGPSGTLTPSGSVTSTADGEIIENLDVSGLIRVKHNNVTVRNCRVSGHNRNTGHIYVAYVDRDVVNSFTVEDCLIVGDDPYDFDDDGEDEAAGIAINATYASVTIRRCRGTNNYSGYRLSNSGNDLVEYSMVENIIHTPPDHNTGMSYRGGSGVRLTRNWVEGSTSSALSLYPDQAPITDLLATENLFDGGTYSVLGGTGKTYSDELEDIKFIDNKFTYNYQYGPRSSYSLTATGNQWLGNIHIEDGTLAGSEVDNEPVPPRIILDTDFAQDADDVGAVALAHGLADQGEVTIDAMVVSTKCDYSPGAVDAVNRWHGRQPPIGAYKGTAETSQVSSCGQTNAVFTQPIYDTYPRDVGLASTVPDSTQVYRQTLAAAPDGSVTIVTIGFLTAVSALIDSPANWNDDGLPSGVDLLAAKVDRIFIMGGQLIEGAEFNLNYARSAAANVISNSPVPLTFNPWEIGDAVITATTNFDWSTHPVRFAYDIYDGVSWTSTTAGHFSWDLVTVLQAVRGNDPWFTTEQGTVTFNESNGETTFTAGAGNHTWTYLAAGQASAVEDVIEPLMWNPEVI